jgi:5'-nucleotidase
MKILLDQDEVLAKWNSRILQWWNEDCGTALTEDDIEDNWNLEKILGPGARHFIRSCMRWPDFYTDLEEVEGAVEGVRTLMDMGHDVMIVSAVPTTAAIAYHGKCQWLRKHMPFFSLDNFVAIKRKDRMIGDLLFDDGPHNLKAWKATGRIAVAMDRRHNRDADCSARVKNWKEFISYIKFVDTLSTDSFSIY